MKKGGIRKHVVGKTVDGVSCLSFNKDGVPCLSFSHPNTADMGGKFRPKSLFCLAGF